jgi:ribonuclease HI
MDTKVEQLRHVQEMIEVNKYDYIISTDGSKLGERSYGKAGAAAIIYKRNIDSTPSQLKALLGTESNSFMAEMVGIQLGLKFVKSVEVPSKVLFLCDCTEALKSSFELPVQREYNHISRSNLHLVLELQAMGHHLEAAWVQGHRDFAPNEEADRIAKQAAEESKAVRYPAEKKEVTNILKEKVKENWQFRVDVNLMNHKVAAINRVVGTWFTPKLDGIHLLNQFATGHNQLNYHMSKFLETTSKYCTCGGTEDEDHFMYECECYSKFRFELLMELNLLCGTGNTSLRGFSWRTLMGQDTSLTKTEREKVVSSVLDFVKKTKRFTK